MAASEQVVMATAAATFATARRGRTTARLSGTAATTIEEAKGLDAGSTGQNHSSPEGQRNNKTTVHGETPKNGEQDTGRPTGLLTALAADRPRQSDKGRRWAIQARLEPLA